MTNMNSTRAVQDYEGSVVSGITNEESINSENGLSLDEKKEENRRNFSKSAME